MKERARMLDAVRQFFKERHVLEVDCPVLSPAASIDLHIDLMRTEIAPGLYGYLHSSPEYGMKRLLSEGIGDIYQLSHVFRRGEMGALHHPEFTMIEWYRIGMSFEEMMKETCALIRLFLGKLEVESLSYKEAFERWADIDCFADSVRAPKEADPHWDRDTLLDYLYTHLIEPKLGQGKLTVLHSFPKAQAALAKCCTRDGHEVAERFEIYHQGIELANGYHELTDAKEQRHRLEKANRMRMERGKEELPIDEDFLAALEKGLPDCCGVAVGFDRLMMIQQRASSLKEVSPFISTPEQ